MQITKASGLSEEFSEKKLLNSIKVAGVPEDVGKKAIQLVKDKLSSDTDTHKIHELVSQYLNQHSNPLSQATYSLKRAIFKLGPTGYPFEQFFAKVLQEFGYHTKVGVVLEGKCVNHEVDIVAKKDNQVFYIECKFHNRPGLKTDVQVALYTNARFQDIESNVVEVDHPKGVQPPLVHRSWLVSNTKITKDATNYANCQNIKTTSWNHPGKEGLFRLVVDSKLHPITVLNSLSKDKMRILLKQDIVTLKDLIRLINNNQLASLLSKQDIKKVKTEANLIYS